DEGQTVTEDKLRQAEQSDAAAAKFIAAEDSRVDGPGSKESELRQKRNQVGVLASIKQILWETRRLIVIYVAALIGCLMSGAAVPLQAYIFAKFTNVFTEIVPRSEFVKNGNFWALMFLVL